MQRHSAVGEYLTMTFNLWGKHLAGPILAVISIASAIASAIWWSDPTVLAHFAKWSACLTGLATVSLIFRAQYDAWQLERDSLEAERNKNAGSHITGELQLGYIDTRNYHFDVKSWQTLSLGCYVTVYVTAVNHNECSALFWAGKTTAELKVGQQCFSGQWVQINLGLSFKDENRLNPNSQVYDFFGSLRPRSPMQRSIPLDGFMCFIFENFDRNLLTDKTSIQAGFKIVIHDTLDKTHEIEGDLDLLIGSVCLQGEAGIPQA
jgi:hypothetical protein